MILACLKARIVSSPQTATNRRVENVEPYIAVNHSWNEAFSDLSGVVKNEMVSGDLRILDILWRGIHTEPLQSPKGPFSPNGQANASAGRDVDQGSRWEI